MNIRWSEFSQYFHDLNTQRAEMEKKYQEEEGIGEEVEPLYPERRRSSAANVGYQPPNPPTDIQQEEQKPPQEESKTQE